jgi:DNA-binding NtrC family response regulator
MIPFEPTPAGDDIQGKDAVLVVDDERPLLDIYTAVLDPHFQVTTAANVTEAETLLRRQPFKVILGDHLMPGEPGLDFLIRAREAFPRLQRVLITGYLRPEMMETASTAGLFRCLTKPVSLGTLIEVVRSAVRAHDAGLLAAP